MISALIDPPRQRHIAVLALMTGLPARLAQRLLRPLPGQRTPLLARHRRILRRRQRAVTLIPSHTPLELLHLRPQLRDLLTQQRVLRPQLGGLRLKLSLTPRPGHAP